MFDIGFSEVLLIFVIALVVLGPEKLPRVASQVGRWVGRARAMARQFREQLEEEVNLEEVRRAQEKKPSKPAEPAPQSGTTQSEPGASVQPGPGSTSGAAHDGNEPFGSSSEAAHQGPEAFGSTPGAAHPEHEAFGAAAGPDPVDFRADTFSQAHPVDTFSHAHPTNEHGANPLTPNGAPDVTGNSAEEAAVEPQRTVSGEAYAPDTPPTAQPSAGAAATARTPPREEQGAGKHGHS